jgi:transposase
MEVVMTKHKPYTAEYKLSAVQLAQTEGVSKTATSLGINAKMLSRWKREHELGIAQARPTFTGKGNAALTEQEKENQQLRRELEIARQERDILKKALACLGQKAAPCGLGRFFAKETR